MSRRFVGSVILAALLAGVMGAPASCEEYPSRPIRLLVSSSAGSLVDVLSRLLTQELSARLSQTIVVDNRAGAMTQVAMEALTRAPPDGYTLMIGPSELAMMPFLKKSYHYAAGKDFAPVALFASSWTVFAINPKVPAQTLPELVSYAKAHPGAIHYGSGGGGGGRHLRGPVLRLQNGAEFLPLPYQGGSRGGTEPGSGPSRLARTGPPRAGLACPRH